jgi:GT2 family glycosyltransferase
MKDLSVIILNHKAKEFLFNCLESILRSDFPKSKLELIVVDNASGDDTVPIVKKKFPQAAVISSKSNDGFAAGNNLGIPGTTGKFILFLNPDTLVKEDTLSKTFSFLAAHPQIGAITCKVNLASGKLDEACHRGFPTPWNSFCHFSHLEKLFPHSRLFSGYTMGYLPLNTAHEIDSASGAFLMVRREAGEQIGWWDEDYFFYGEDLDFCFSLKEKGWQIYYYPQTEITHFRGISSGIIKHSRDISTSDSETRIKAARASTQAMRIFYRKHYLKIYPKFVNRLIMFGINIMEKRRISEVK